MSWEGGGVTASGACCLTDSLTTNLFPRRCAPAVAVTSLTRCRQILIDRGRFRQAADREKGIAELYKNEAHDPEKALQSYEQAAEWYIQEGAAA